MNAAVVQIANCPRGEASCAITAAEGARHECVNTKTDLDNCGGCSASGKGTVCGREHGVRSASCDGGICYIRASKAFVDSRGAIPDPFFLQTRAARDIVWICIRRNV